MADALSILIVDDDASDLAAIESAVERLDCVLHKVSDPHEVLEAVRREKPTVVILDALLPGLSGFDLCKQIKEDPDLTATQVLIVTGVYIKDQYQQEALQIFKADAFMTKPFRAPELQRLAGELLTESSGELPASEPATDPAELLPAPAKKRGLLERLFGKGAAEPEAGESGSALGIAEEPEERQAPESEPVDAPMPGAEEDGEPLLEAPVSAEPEIHPEVEPERVDAVVSETSGDVVDVPEEAARATLLSPDATLVASPVIAAERAAPALEAVPVPETSVDDAPADEDDVSAEAATNGEASAPSIEAEDVDWNADTVPIYREDRFRAELKREIARCRRVDRPLTLILIKIRDLSQIVELFGGDIREPVQKHVAERAAATLREVDLVGVMSSPDLVALVAFASDKYGGERVILRIRDALTKTPFRVGEELPPIVPELGFGVVSFPEDASEAAELIASAIDHAGDS